MKNDGLIEKLEKGKPDLDGADTYEVGFEAGVSFSIRQTQNTKADILRELDKMDDEGLGLNHIDRDEVKKTINDLMGGE